jgi:hypothetical protein
MSIMQGATTSFKLELLEGVHNFLTDTFKIALYTGNANLGSATTVYVTSDEVTGTGYTAGGNTLTVIPPASSGTVAYVSFQNTSWASASFTARAALIYNATQGNKSVAVLDFGADKTVSNSTFTITFPVDDATNAIVRVA